jgi:hypothetical protein
MKRMIFIFSLLCLSVVVHAEGNCPQGYYPIGASGQPGPQGCAPIPDYNQNQGQPQASPIQWRSTWGAIATDTAAGSLGSATGKVSADEAEEAALADCRAKGGNNCKLQISYRNGCGAVVVGGDDLEINSAATLDEAIQKGMDLCNSVSKDCHVYFTTCSPPERIQ